MTAGAGVDSVLDALSPGAPPQATIGAMMTTARCGTVVTVGEMDENLPFDPIWLTCDNIAYQGSAWLSTLEGHDMANMARAEVEAFDLSPLENLRFSLDSVNEVLGVAATSQLGRPSEYRGDAVGETAAGDRRIVTYVNGTGRSRMLPGQEATRAAHDAETPGMRGTILWSTTGIPVLGSQPKDPAFTLASLHPPIFGSTFLVLTLPLAGFMPIRRSITLRQRTSNFVTRPVSPTAWRPTPLAITGLTLLIKSRCYQVKFGWPGDEEVCLHAGDTVVQVGARAPGKIAATRTRP